MIRMTAAGLAALLGFATPRPAMAYPSMTCAQAMTLVASHPGIEANSIITMVVDQWQAMDRRTVAGGHAPIAAQMLAGPAAINALSADCSNNPGQRLAAAAAQIYRQARSQLDGF
jgi:hypothetical protein